MKWYILPHRGGGLWLSVQFDLTLLAALCACGLPTTSVRGAIRDWTGAVNGYWSEPGNWSPVGALRTGDYLQFGWDPLFGSIDDNPSHRDMTNDLDSLVLDGLEFGRNDYSLTGNEITLTNFGSFGAVEGGTCDEDCAVRLNDIGDFFTGTNSALFLNGAISGDAEFWKEGPGTIFMIGPANNSYSANTVVRSGLLVLGRNPGVICVPGDLLIGPAPAGSTAEVRINQLGGFGGAPAITVNSNSLFNLSGDSETVSALNLNDGGSVQTGSGVLDLTGGATIYVGSFDNPYGSHVSTSIQGNIGLTPNSAGAHFTVYPYAANAPFDSRPELDVRANIFVDGYEQPGFIPAGISKDGVGRMRLGGANTYRGTTLLTAGTLQVDGVQTNSEVFINGGTLTGTGRVGGIYLNSPSATVAPGDEGNPGTLECSDFGGSGGSGIFRVQLDNGPGYYSKLYVHGAVNLTGISLQGSLNYAPAAGDQFVIIDNLPNASVVGTFNGLPDGALTGIGNELFRVNYTLAGYHDAILTAVEPAPVLKIEPAGRDAVRLLWPAGNAFFALQSAANLNATNWSSVSPASTVIGTNNVVTNAVNGQQNFYRLILLDN